jgi:N-acetylglucosamine-6-phosphate deacetylase
VSPAAISGRDPATGRTLAVEIADGVIAAVHEAPGPADLYLSPGLVDLQVNGYAGIDLNSGALTPAEVSALARRLAGLGVTSFLPTLITAPEATIVAGLSAIAAARAADPLVHHMVPFAHIEGPFIAPDDGPRGAHPRAEVRPPDLAEFARWQAACGGLVGLLTVSPHWPEAPAFIAAVTGQGVHVSLGHTGAMPAEIAAAVEAGARLSTHLGNGAAALLPRHPNFIWTQLAEDRLTATFIADGHHLPADTFRVMLRAKGLERAILVSDVAALAGLPPGRYEQPIGGRVELTADGRLGVAGTPYLAGAARNLAEDVAVAIGLGGLTLAEALRLATANPGRFAGGRGRLEPGAPADLIRFAWAPGAPTLEIETVLVAGEEVG